MKLKNRKGLIAALVAGLLGASVALPAAAQSDASGMPQEQHQGDASFVSGGVGLDESHALRAAKAHWPLALQFTGPGADYLSDVHVRITGAGGNDVMSADARGPYMLVKLPSGKYTVHAKYKGNEKTQSVSISGNGHANASFHWNQQ